MSVDVGDPPHGPVAENETAAPEPIEIAVVMLVADSVVVTGVAYVLVTAPSNVKPVPKVPAVCAKSPAEIWLKEPLK